LEGFCNEFVLNLSSANFCDLRIKIFENQQIMSENFIIKIMNTKAQKLEAFSKLLDIMDDLREKCPWDKKQDLQSLRHLTLEEVYELSDALLEEDLPEVKKELGDVLLHLVFYAKIGSEKNAFDIADVINFFK